jgi:pyruvate,water dikinase
MTGMCFVFEENDNEFENCNISKNPINLKKDSSLVLSLNEETAKSVELSGGKGSSLSQLMHLREKLREEKSENNFKVPNGIIVTTNAYKEMIKETNLETDINRLEKLAFSQSRDNLKNECENLVQLISKQKLPKSIRTQIEKKLNQTFDNFENKLFAVRSSASGEDSEEMSAAGQMITYLGVKGFLES